MKRQERSDRRILITNIQRFSLHDGPGIRTTVFLKGCNLHCPWCSNPENIEPFIQEYIKDGKKEYFGYYITADNLIEELLKDKAFYGEYDGEVNWLEGLPGGVTLSGGEPLLQAEALLPVLKKLRNEHIHIAAETALFVPRGLLEVGCRFIDLFYIDLKLLDYEMVRQVEKGNVDCFLQNFEWLMKKEKKVIIRIPVISAYTDSAKNQERILELLVHYKQRIIKVELLKGHDLGASKYRDLGQKAPCLGVVSDRIMNEYCEKIKRICGLIAEVYES